MQQNNRFGPIRIPEDNDFSRPTTAELPVSAIFNREAFEKEKKNGKFPRLAKALLIRVAESNREFYIFRPMTSVLHRPQEKKSRFVAQIYDCPSTCVFFLNDIPSFCHNSSHTSDSKMNHPAMDSLVLSLQCGSAAVVFRPFKDRHCRSSFQKVVPEGWILIFPVLYPVITLLLYEQVRVRAVVFFPFFWVRAARYNHMVPYDM